MKNILFSAIWVLGFILPTATIYIAYKGWKRNNPYAIIPVSLLAYLTYVIV